MLENFKRDIIIIQYINLIWFKQVSKKKNVLYDNHNTHYQTLSHLPIDWLKNKFGFLIHQKHKLHVHVNSKQQQLAWKPCQ